MAGARFVLFGGSFGDPDREAAGMAAAMFDELPDRPTVAYLGTANGNDPSTFLRCSDTMARRGASVIPIQAFPHTTPDAAAVLGRVDAIFLAGGSTMNLLAIWRMHGLDGRIRDAAARGALICGVSAGGNCLARRSTTRSMGGDVSALEDGLGLLDFGLCPHVEEPARRETAAAMARSGPMLGITSTGWARVLQDGTVDRLTEAFWIEPA